MFDSGTLGLGGVEVPVPFFLIRHAQGNVLVDGGNAMRRGPGANGHTRNDAARDMNPIDHRLLAPIAAAAGHYLPWPAGGKTDVGNWLRR